MEEHGATSMTGCLVHLFRILVGPSFALILGIGLVVNHPPVGGPLDAAFAVVVGLLIAAAFLDRDWSEAAEGGGKRGRRLRYVAGVAGTAVVVYVVAHVLAPQFL